MVRILLKSGLFAGKPLERAFGAFRAALLQALPERLMALPIALNILRRDQQAREYLRVRATRLVQAMRTHKLLTLGLMIHGLFYISVLWTDWLNVFFSGESLHVATKYIDFLQVPRGAYDWWHSGPLTGVAMHGVVYGPVGYWVNPNVYHPLFTLELGSILMLFKPDVAWSVWIWMKVCLDVLTIDYFWRAVRESPYGEFATFILLVSLSEYAELAAGQYHFVLNICLLFFLVMLEQKQRRLRVLAAIYYAGSMLVKPIGLLFVPALLFKRRWNIALLALVVVILVTWPFLLDGSGRYYVENLSQNILHPSAPGPDQIITLNALLHFVSNWPARAYEVIQYTVLGAITLLSALKSTPMSRAIFFSVVYFLLFYPLVYEYDWSTLSYVLPVCLVLDPAFQSKPARLCALLTCLPSCFVLLRIFHVDVSYSAYLGWHPGILAWKIMVVSKLVPVLALCGCVLASDALGWRRRRAHRNPLDHTSSEAPSSLPSRVNA